MHSVSSNNVAVGTPQTMQQDQEYISRRQIQTVATFGNKMTVCRHVWPRNHLPQIVLLFIFNKEKLCCGLGDNTYGLLIVARPRVHILHFCLLHMPFA